MSFPTRNEVLCPSASRHTYLYATVADATVGREARGDLDDAIEVGPKRTILDPVLQSLGIDDVDKIWVWEGGQWVKVGIRSELKRYLSTPIH